VSIRILARADVERLMPVSDCIEPMAAVLAALAREQLLNPLRVFVRPPGADTSMALMPAYRSEPPLYALKTACVAPGNAARGMESHQGFVALFDGQTGETRALLNAAAVTGIRTAAVSALATRLLARPDSRTLAILGSGTQARFHLEGLRAVLPFDRVTAWSRTPGHASRLPDVEEVPTARDAVRDADVIATVTAAKEPILSYGWLKPGAHINAVGSSKPFTRELDSATMAAAAIYTDRRESLLRESGDYLFPAQEGAIGPQHVRGELGELLVGHAEGRQSESELTVFKSLGLAVEDLAAGEYVLGLAEQAGVGVEVEL
jgi:ornithine cyclodeaminase/alanine dehydrogenase-like protein (mu-crystallin family)